MKQCPVCSCRLRQVTSRNVVVDICSNCSGVWFDSGELQVFLRDLVNSTEITPQQTGLFQPRNIETEDHSTAQRRMCPKCSLVMKTFNYAYDSNVFVDKCPDCEGIWADAGEVKKLARHLKKDPQASMIAQNIVERQRSLDELKDWADLSEKLGRRVPSYILFMPKIIIPLGDDNQSEKIPALTFSIIIMCTAIFLLQLIGISDIEAFYSRFGFIPQNFWSIGLIASMFLHGGIFHLLGNMFFLWVFGDNVEDRFGHLKYTVFYLSCGIVANVLHTLFYMDSGVPAIGASGAISGVMGAYCVLFPKARLKLFCICQVVTIPAYLYLTIWFVLQLLYGTMSLSYDAVCGVAWFAHIGGFVFGMFVAYFLKKLAHNPNTKKSASSVSSVVI